MRKGNKIFEALSANFERANSPFCIDCVKPDESAALDELFAIPEATGALLVDDVQALNDAGRRESSERGALRAPARGAARRPAATPCPPTTNRGA